MNSISILQKISAELNRLGVPFVFKGKKALTVSHDFVDALWSWHVDPIHYELSVNLDEPLSTILLSEKIADSDPVLYRKVIFSKMTDDGTRLDTVLDLGIIAKTITAIAEEAHWRIFITDNIDTETSDLDEPEIADDQPIDFVQPLRVKYDPRWLKVAAAGVAAVFGVFLFSTILNSAGYNINQLLNSNPTASGLIQIDDEDVPLANPDAVDINASEGDKFARIGQFKFYSAYDADQTAHIYRYDVFSHTFTTIYDQYAWAMTGIDDWLYFNSYASGAQDGAVFRYRIQPDGSQLEQVN